MSGPANRAAPARTRRLARGAWLLALAVGCGGDGAAPATTGGASAPESSPAPAPETPLFAPHTAASGIDFEHVHGGVGNRELPETMGGGLALFDFDGDGDLDLAFSQSGPVRLPVDGAGPVDRAGAENRLFENDSAGRFTPVAGAAGAADDGYGQGLLAGDADGDGWDELLSLNWGPNVLYHNTHGHFEDATLSAGILGEDRWSVSATWIDAEGDGDLDLYVVNYLGSPPASYALPHINPRAPEPFGGYPHPDRFAAERDRYYRNRGGPTLGFEEATSSAGFDVAPGKGLGVVTTDVELDGQLDLYVTNDSTPNFLFHNDGRGQFEELGARVGVAFNDHGQTEAGMGVDTADVDGDGDLELFATNLDNETNTLYENRTAERGADELRDAYRDRTRAHGLAEPSRGNVGFGTLFLDANRDGWADLFVANGHIIDNVETISDSLRYAQPDQLFLGGPDGRFREAAPELVPGFEEPTVARGSALGDLDGDGAPDLVVGANNGAPRLYLGTPPELSWLGLTLRGPGANRRGLGATVQLELVDGRVITGRVDAGRAYASSGEPRFHTGLSAPVAAVFVLWPGGSVERWAPEDFRGEQQLAEGTGVPAALPRGRAGSR